MHDLIFDVFNYW